MGEKGDGGGKLRDEEKRRAGLNRTKELKGRRRERERRRPWGKGEPPTLKTKL